MGNSIHAVVCKMKRQKKSSWLPPTAQSYPACFDEFNKTWHVTTSEIFMPSPSWWPEALCFQSVRACVRESQTLLARYLWYKFVDGI